MFSASARGQKRLALRSTGRPADPDPRAAGRALCDPRRAQRCAAAGRAAGPAMMMSAASCATDRARHPGGSRRAILPMLASLERLKTEAEILRPKRKRDASRLSRSRFGRRCCSTCERWQRASPRPSNARRIEQITSMRQSVHPTPETKHPRPVPARASKGVDRNVSRALQQPTTFSLSQNENRDGFFGLLANNASNAMKGASRWPVDRARQH